MPPNRSMKTPQHLVNAFDFMHTVDFKVVGGLSLSRQALKPAL
jgi:hypothetical protein